MIRETLSDWLTLNLRPDRSEQATETPGECPRDRWLQRLEGTVPGKLRRPAELCGWSMGAAGRWNDPELDSTSPDRPQTMVCILRVTGSHSSILSKHVMRAGAGFQRINGSWVEARQGDKNRTAKTRSLFLQSPADRMGVRSVCSGSGEVAGFGTGMF